MGASSSPYSRAQMLTRHDPTQRAASGSQTLRDPSVRDDHRTHRELRRYELPTSGCNVSVITPLRLFDEHGRRSWLAELPTLNPSFSGRRACYCYLWCPQCASDLSWESMALIKKDLCNESAPVVTWMRQGHFPGEATFVPRPATTPPTRRLAWPLASAIDPALAAPEDDGVLLASVHQGALETYLLVINATTMATIAEIRQPHSAHVGHAANEYVELDGDVGRHCPRLAPARVWYPWPLLAEKADGLSNGKRLIDHRWLSRTSRARCDRRSCYSACEMSVGDTPAGATTKAEDGHAHSLCTT